MEQSVVENMNEQAMRAIDVHTHMVPSSIPAYRGHGTNVPWPSIHHHKACCAQVLVGGQVFREIEDSCWLPGRRADDMHDMGISRQMLSPMPELLSYWMEGDDTLCLSRHVNQEIAALVQANPRRFRGLGMVPLQSPQVAAEELAYLMNRVEFDGVEIGTNVGGRPIGDVFFEPFFTVAEALGAIVFVHPLRATGTDRLLGPPGMEQVIAFPCETAFAIASLITGGMLHRHPGLKLVFSHGGGAFGQILPRLQHAWTFMPALQKASGDAPVKLAERLYFDSLVYSRAALRFLIEQFGDSRIVIGTDYPFAILDKTPLKSIEALALDAEGSARICHGNLERLFVNSHGRPA